MPRADHRDLEVLDGFRAYALAGVVVVHVLGMSGALAATRGTALGGVIAGVLGNVIDAFFIISGFLLFLPTVMRGGRFGSVRAYAVGRATRLLPAYWACLALLVALIALAPPLPQLEAPTPLSVALHLTTLQMPAKLFDGTLALGFGIDGPVWMISIIAGFYVVLPVVAAAYLRRPLVGLAIAAAITVGWKLAVVHADELFVAMSGGGVSPGIVRLIATDQLPGWAFSFALGMTGAWAYGELRRRGGPTAAARRRAIRWLVPSLLAYGIFAYLYSREWSRVPATVAGSYSRESPLIALGSSASRTALMAAIALGPAWLLRPFANAAVRRLGTVSFGLYLIHIPIGLYAAGALGLPRDGSPGTVALWLLIVVPPALAYAYASLRLVERPARRWGRSLERRLVTTTQVPTRAPSVPISAPVPAEAQG